MKNAMIVLMRGDVAVHRLMEEVRDSTLHVLENKTLADLLR